MDKIRLTSQRLLSATLLAATLGAVPAFGADMAAVDEARGLAEGGNVPAAIGRLRQGLIENPDDAAARLMLGRLYLERGNYGGAQKELRVAVSLGIPRVTVLAPLAEALFGERRYEELLEEVHALEADSAANRARIHVFRGRAHLASGDAGAARAEYEAALVADPSHGEAMAELARQALGQGDLAAARELAEEAIAASPDAPATWYMRSLLEQTEGRYADAVDTLRTALEKDPDYHLARIALAGALAKLKRYDEALKEVRRVEQVLPDQPQALYVHAEILYHQGAYEAARDQLYKLLRLDANHLKGNLLMAFVVTKTGETETALFHLDRVLAQYPRSLSAIQLRGALLLQAGEPEKVLETVGPDVGEAQSDPILTALAARAALAQSDLQAAHGLVDHMLFRAEGAQLPGRADAMRQLDAGNLDGALAVIEQGLNQAEVRYRTALRAGLEALDKGDWDLALTLARTVLTAQPEQALAWELSSRALLARGETAEAEKGFRYALKLDPSLVGSAVAVAGMTARQGDLEGARAQLRGVIEQRPDFVQAHLVLARLERADGDSARALAVLRSAAEAMPDRAVILAALGELQWAAGQADAALASFQRLVELAPENPQARYLLAMAFGAKGDWERAETLLREAQGLDAEHLPSGLALARLAIQRKQYEEAERVTADLEGAHPASADVQDLAVELAWARDRKEDAVAAAHRALELGPNRMRVMRLFTSQWRVQQNEKAVETVQEWVESHPDDFQVRLALADAQLRLGRREGALESYQRVLESDPASLAALNNLAMLLKDERPDQALAYAQRALETAPDQPAVIDTLALVHMATENYTEAAALLEKAAEQAPDKPSLRFHLAQALAGIGDKAAARAQLQGILKTETEFPERAEAESLLATLK